MNAETIVSQGQQHVETAADGEVVLMHVESGRFFTLTGTGQRVWELIAEPISIDALAERLAGEYDVEPETCRNDVLEICRQLEASALIDVSA